MHDESFSRASLQMLIRNSDLKNVPFFAVRGAKELIATQAAAQADALFGSTNPLRLIHVHGKPAFRPTSIQTELILRKMVLNLKRSFKQTTRGRRFIVSTLVAHLSEGLPYRVYKRDVFHFYPSFPHNAVERVLDADTRITSMTKILVKRLFHYQRQLGGEGLPIGLGISAVLSEKMMQDFDHLIRSHPQVRYYARYVDDIVIVTNGDEHLHDFSAFLCRSLPRGLRFNAIKSSASATNPPGGAPTTGELLSLNYLGYSIRVQSSPSDTHRRDNGSEVLVDLSQAKVKKVKTRIVRTLHAYTQKQDIELFKRRISFLTSNASIPVPGQSTKRLVGIYHTYPLITLMPGCRLYELDQFFRGLLLSPRGRLCRTLYPLLSKAERIDILRFSFVDGFKQRRFVDISRGQFLAIRKCWRHE